jgi:hypothetical protein
MLVSIMSSFQLDPSLEWDCITGHVNLEKLYEYLGKKHKFLHKLKSENNGIFTIIMPDGMIITNRSGATDCLDLLKSKNIYLDLSNLNLEIMINQVPYTICGTYTCAICPRCNKILPIYKNKHAIVVYTSRESYNPIITFVDRELPEHTSMTECSECCSTITYHD